MTKQPIFILGVHKSGTSLVRSLFDGHSELFTVPIETHFFYHLNYWISYALRNSRNRPGSWKLKDFIDSVKEGILYSNTEENPLADSVTKGLFSIEDFNTHIDNSFADVDLDTDKLELAKCFSTFMGAIYRSIFRVDIPNNIRILEKSTESFEFALELNKVFPDACFIHIIRNPYSNLVALRKYRTFNRKSSVKRLFYPWIEREIFGLSQAFYFLQKNNRLIENYHVFRYEDLVSEPQIVIKKLSDIADLSYQEILFRPTFLGNPWKGNSSSGKLFSGISSAGLHKWKKEIKDLEIHLVNKHLRHCLEQFGYEILHPSRPLYFPVGGELITEYVANRIFYMKD